MRNERIFINRILVVVDFTENCMDEYITDRVELGYFTTWAKARAFKKEVKMHPHGYFDIRIENYKLDEATWKYSCIYSK